MKQFNSILKLAGPQACGKSKFVHQFMELNESRQVLVTTPQIARGSFISGICEDTKYLVIEDASQQDYEWALKTFRVQPFAFNRKGQEPLYIDELTIIVVVTEQLS